MLIPSYLRWHYGTALKNTANIILNVVWFLWHFFSIGILSETLFAPWERLSEKRERGLDIEGFLGTLILNTVMRAVGAIVRSVFIVIGLGTIIAAIICGAFFFCAWLVLPALIVFSLAFGIILLFKPI